MAITTDKKTVSTRESKVKTDFDVVFTNDYINECNCGKKVVMQEVLYKSPFSGHENKEREMFIALCKKCRTIFFGGDYPLGLEVKNANN